MHLVVYTLAVFALGAGLAIFSYLDRIYRELSRVSTGRLRAHLDVFEATIEPRIGLDRRRGALTFSLLSNLWLALVAVETARGVTLFVPRLWEALVEMVVFVTTEVIVGVYFIPYLLLARTQGRWLMPFLPAIRVCTWIAWPFRTAVEVAVSVAHISEEEEPTAKEAQEGRIEALVEAAQEQGILAGDEAQLIEQVVEFGDKRVREVMTPRPDVISISAEATIEQLRRLAVETKYSRIPVHDGTLDDIVGVVYVRDLLRIPQSEGSQGTVRDLVRPAMFVPEMKLGSQLLKEMQQKNQQMAIVVDEYGSVAGLVTLEDLVEEIVGEIGEEDRAPVPDVVRESDGSLVMRGSLSLARVQELFGVHFAGVADEAATTIAGLLNTVVGHVPAAGERIDYDGLHFEVLEANQRKVLRLRARKPAVAAAQGPS